MGKSLVIAVRSSTERNNKTRSCTWAKRIYLWRLLSSCRAPLTIKGHFCEGCAFVSPGLTLLYLKKGRAYQNMTRASYGGLCGIPACGQAVGCGVSDTPELWRGAAGLCLRICECAGAAEFLHIYVHTNMEQIYLRLYRSRTMICSGFGLKVPCAPKWNDFEFPIIKTTKPLVKTRSCTGAKRI